MLLALDSYERRRRYIARVIELFVNHIFVFFDIYDLKPQTPVPNIPQIPIITTSFTTQIRAWDLGGFNGVETDVLEALGFFFPIEIVN